ncbi:MAG: iron-only hydrogenase system regulator [Thermoguttaceae bacterium]|nr:iron-only hydrogenase system regulator [Thermoguttaceae bacterium]
MGKRIAIIGIIVEESRSVEQINALLSDYSEHIIGRMGIPYRPHGVNVISVMLDAPPDIISSLSGKLGMLPGVSAKSVCSKKETGG